MVTVVGDTLAALAPTAGAVGLLMLITAGVLTWSRSHSRFAPALAVVRGALQLGLISLVLGGVITSGFLVGCALLVMFTVAAATAARQATLDLAAGALTAVVLVRGLAPVTVRPAALD